MTIEFEGSVLPACGLGRGGDISLGEIGQGGQSITAGLGLSCNVPFDLSVVSTNGGLAHQTMPGGQGPYAGTLKYSMRVDVPVVEPAARMVSASYTSDQLRGPQTLSTQDGVSLGGAALQIDMATVTGAGLLAGSYSDTIEITIAPRLGN